MDGLPFIRVQHMLGNKMMDFGSRSRHLTYGYRDGDFVIQMNSNAKGV